MKVSVKDLNVTMELKNKGIELDVYDSNDDHRGDLIISRGKIEWCKGKTHAGKGIQVSWDKFIAWFEGQAK